MDIEVLRGRIIKRGCNMKTIGLIGGMSWESSLEYYRIINQLVQKELGAYHSAKSVMVSVDFDEIEQYQQTGEWEKAGEQLKEAAIKLEKAGVDFIVLCTNTMHKVANQIEQGVAIPFLHIADGTAEEISKNGLKKIGLLGTKYTMEQDFYVSRLTDQFGLEVLVPDELDRGIVNEIIFNELVFGKINETSKLEYQRVIDKLVAKGAEGIILGCTEITLLIKQEDSPVPVFDTTFIHAKKAVERALKLI